MSTTLSAWANPDHLSVAASFLADRATGMTIAGWVQCFASPSGFQTAMQIFEAANPASNTDVAAISDGGGFPIVYRGPGFAANIIGVAPGTSWTYFALTYTFSSPGLSDISLRTIQGTIGSLAITGSSSAAAGADTSWTADTLQLFRDVMGDGMSADSQVAFWGVWASPLSNPELLAQAASQLPVLPSSAFWPLENGALTDISGGGNPLVLSSGTLTAGTTQPPVDPLPPPAADSSALFFLLV
jgi:hypothetical protein